MDEKIFNFISSDLGRKATVFALLLLLLGSLSVSLRMTIMANFYIRSAPVSGSRKETIFLSLHVSF